MALNPLAISCKPLCQDAEVPSWENFLKLHQAFFQAAHSYWWSSPLFRFNQMALEEKLSMTIPFWWKSLITQYYISERQRKILALVWYWALEILLTTLYLTLIWCSQNRMNCKSKMTLRMNFLKSGTRLPNITWCNMWYSISTICICWRPLMSRSLL